MRKRSPPQRSGPIPPTRPALAFYAFAQRLLLGVSRAMWRVSIEGTELVPTSGAFIVAPTHRSNIDTILMSAVTRRRMCYLAKDSLWRSRPLGWLVSALGGFPVHRGAPDREALAACVEALEQGQPLVVFPEGTRRSGAVVAELFEGAAYLSLRTGVPIVPVGIGGSEGALPKGARMPARVRVHMIVGPPLHPPGPAGPVAGPVAGPGPAGRLAGPGPASRDGEQQPAGRRRVSRRQVDSLTDSLHRELQGLFDRANEAARGAAR